MVGEERNIFRRSPIRAEPLHPGTQTNANWTWRMLPGQTTAELAKKIRRLTVLYGRGSK